tara:strand:- start:89 stop:214 length:126 start_codon:yes stop_codon:yes gene_type:complete
MKVREILKLYQKKPLLVMEEGKLDLINGKDKKNIEVKVGNG